MAVPWYSAVKHHQTAVYWPRGLPVIVPVTFSICYIVTTSFWFTFGWSHLCIQTSGQASVPPSKKMPFEIPELLLSNNWVVDFLHRVQRDVKRHILIQPSVHCCTPISGPQWALGANLLLQGSTWAYHTKVCNYCMQKGPHFPHLTPRTVDFHRTSTEIDLVWSLGS